LGLAAGGRADRDNQREQACYLQARTIHFFHGMAGWGFTNRVLILDEYPSRSLNPSKDCVNDIFENFRLFKPKLHPQRPGYCSRAMAARAARIAG
jgi:hypothetical protein